MKHNFENNLHKIQGRMKMKKNLDSHSRNRNVQRYNLYISRTAENQEIITCNARKMEEKSMNTLNYVDNLMLEQHIHIKSLNLKLQGNMLRTIFRFLNNVVRMIK